MKIFSRINVGGVLLCAVLSWAPQALAGVSPYCPGRAGTVAQGGSVAIDVSDCDGPLDIAIGVGPAAVPPVHGTALVQGTTAGNAQEVIYTHDGSATGSDSFGLEDEDGNIATITITVTAGSSVVITPTSLTLQTGAPFSQMLTAAGGVAPYTYSVSGAGFPAGLNLNTSSGLLDGTPTVRGNYSFTVTAVDANSTVGVKAYGGTLTNPVLSFSPASITVATGQAASAQLTALGGVSPYTFSLQPGSTLPAGLSLSPGGLLTGTPSVPGTANVSISVTDGSQDPQNPNATFSQVLAYSVVVSNATAPDAPTIGTASAGNHQASVTFTAPGSNGGSAITGYTATCGAQSQNGSASPIVVTGLTNGTLYNCSVAASNSVGTGASSGLVSVTPVGPPDAPSLVSVTPGNTQATVAFNAPASDGGSAITGYTASCGAFSMAGASSPLTVAGLSNGTNYSCSVTATNALGTGVASAALLVTPATVPDAPTIGSATAGSGQASVAFTAPASNGGSAITAYTVSCGVVSMSGAASPITVTGLANGTTYSCSVVATNAVGSSGVSAGVNVTPIGVPGAPTIGVVTPGSGQASVAFTAPVSNGGSAILSYTATCGAFSTTGAASPLVVVGLTNGTSYSCSVRATNAAGLGAASGSASVTPAAVPDAPTIGAAIRGNGQAVIAFTPPAVTGGSAITGYTATCGAFSASGAASPLTVAGLTNGTAYNCSVTAINAVGTSSPSATVAVTPATVPDAPSITAITSGNAQLSIAFTPAASNGGSAVTGYGAVCNAGGFTATGASSPLVVNGLTNGTLYNCTVTATNAVGNSAASASVPGTPSLRTASGASPTGTGLVTATLSGGGAGCGFATSQFVAANGSPQPGTTFPHGLFDFTTVGCDQGSTVQVAVTYPTAITGNTQYWKYGPTAGQASHWYTVPVTINGSTATFSVKDGDVGDDDLTANGRIVDPGGLGVSPAVSAASIPTVSECVLALMSALLGALAWRQMARRRAA